MNTEISLFNHCNKIIESGQWTYYVEDSIYDDVASWIMLLNSDVDITPHDLVPTALVIKRNYFNMTGKDIFEVVREILIKKSQDYNADRVDDPDFRLDDAREEYFPFGAKSYVHMLHVKVKRIATVSLKEQTNFESLEDSYVDLLAYMIFFYSYLSKE